MSGVEIAGGIGLTIFGVRFLRKGLDRLFGGKLVIWLSKMSGNSLSAFVAGIAIGTIAPTSTGLSLVAAQMLGNGTLSTTGMLAVLLGANVGLTVTVQLLSFRIEDCAGLLIMFGVIGFQFLSRELFRGIGQCVLSLGFVFLAMNLIGHGAVEMAGSPDIVQIFHVLQGHPPAVFVLVSAMAVVLQSSTATIALGLGLAGSGLVTSTLLVPWVIATNVGLGITSLIMGWNEIESRRMGFGNLAIKTVMAVPLIICPAMAQDWFDVFPGSLLRQTAMFHTGFNLVAGILALPFLGLIQRASVFLISPRQQNELTAEESFLDPSVLDACSIALARATRETLRMADKTRLMTEHFWRAFLSGNVDLAQRIQREDDVIDRMNMELKDYLSRIEVGNNPDDRHWQFTLLAFSNELESVGDVIDKQLCDLLIKLSATGVVLDARDRNNLAGAYKRVLERFEIGAGLLTTRSKEDAKAFLAGKEVFNDWCRELQREHYLQLGAATRASLNSSAFFLDFLNGLRRINSHISSLGYAFYPNIPRTRRAKPAVSAEVIPAKLNVCP